MHLSRFSRTSLLQAQHAHKAWKKTFEEQKDIMKTQVSDPYGHGILPRDVHLILPKTQEWEPESIYKSAKPALFAQTLKCPGPDIILRDTPRRKGRDEWMMQPHKLWLKLWDIEGEVLFNHVNNYIMATHHMIAMCTTLVRHLNTLALTQELKAQKALGTLRGSIIAHLSIPKEDYALHSSWDAQNTINAHTVPAFWDGGALARISQNANNTFQGELIDDYIGTTFTIQ